MGFKATLDEFVNYVKAANLRISNATVEISEQYARRALDRKEGPLVYKGLALKCIGTKRWRRAREEKAWLSRHAQADLAVRLKAAAESSQDKSPGSL